MRFRASLCLLFPLMAAAAPRVVSFHVADSSAVWREILSSVGFPAAPPGSEPRVMVLGSGPPPADWRTRLSAGAILIVEGESPLAAELGFRASGRRLLVRSVRDVHRPQLRIVWEQPLELPVFTVPADAQVLAWERWERAPLVAVVRRGEGAVLWLACPPGPKPYARFPYLIARSGGTGRRSASAQSATVGFL
jgi:hypothetical protein